MTLFDILKQLDRNDMRVYKDLVREDNKEIKDIGWMIPQWCTAFDDPARTETAVLLFAQLISPYWSKLSDHPELQLQLLAAIGMGPSKHRFCKQTRGSSVPEELMNLFRQLYPDLRADEIDLAMPSTESELEGMMDQCGIQDIDRKPILKAYKKAMK